MMVRRLYDCKAERLEVCLLDGFMYYWMDERLACWAALQLIGWLNSLSVVAWIIYFNVRPYEGIYFHISLYIL